jgi:hypothetical protein
VDVETFLDDIADVQKGAIAPVAVVVADKVADPRPSGSQDRASPEFVKELEMTVHREGIPVQNAPFVETHEDQDPSPSMTAFNKSFSMFHWGELLSVGYEKADTRDGTSKFLTLWESSKFVDKTGEGSSKQASHHLSGLLFLEKN